MTYPGTQRRAQTDEQTGNVAGASPDSRVPVVTITAVAPAEILSTLEVALRIEYGYLCLRKQTGWLLWSRKLKDIKEDDLWPEIRDALSSPDAAADVETDEPLEHGASND